MTCSSSPRRPSARSRQSTSFQTDDEAVRRANDSPSVLRAYVFGRDLGRVQRVVERLDYGVVGVNDGAPSTAQVPLAV